MNTDLIRVNPGGIRVHPWLFLFADCRARLGFSELAMDARVESQISGRDRAMMATRRLCLVVGLLGSFLLGSPAFAQEAWHNPVLVAVGDSLTAGFANATLMEETQRLSYPALIARQMGIYFGQPYIS